MSHSRPKVVALRRRRQLQQSQFQHPQSSFSRTTSVLCFTFVLTWLVPPARAYYCDDNLCSAEQFCCGENICCNYVNDTVWRLVCAFISVIVCGMVLWGFFQLFLVLIAIYFGGRQQQQKHTEKKGENLQDSDPDQHYYHQPAYRRTGFLADIENGDVSLLYFAKKIMNIAFNRREEGGGRGEEDSRNYLYSSSTSASKSNPTKQSSSVLHHALSSSTSLKPSSFKQAPFGPMNASLMKSSYKKEDTEEKKPSSSVSFH